MYAPKKCAQEECIICFQEMFQHDVIVLSCNHQYHTKCVEKWFQIQNTCPICRQSRPVSKYEEYQQKLSLLTLISLIHLTISIYNKTEIVTAICVCAIIFFKHPLILQFLSIISFVHGLASCMFYLNEGMKLNILINQYRCYILLILHSTLLFYQAKIIMERLQ